MSLPFHIGDVVEIDEEKIFTDPDLIGLVGRQAIVKTMGLMWVKITFEGTSRGFIISNDKLKKVEDENTHRF
jgi:hypothetical protein